MSEGFICRNVSSPELDTRLREIGKDWLIANGDTGITIVETTEIYSNERGRFYSVEFDTDNGEGELEIRFSTETDYEIKMI